MPRSLRACHHMIGITLDELAEGRRLECRRLAGEIHASLQYGRIDQVFARGLHEFLDAFVLSNNRLGQQIQQDFLMSEVVIVD